MIGKKKVEPGIGRKVYFKEKRGSNTEYRYYIGKVIGTRALHRTESNIFGGDRREWDDISLLIETSDGRRIAAWQGDTFEVAPA